MAVVSARACTEVSCWRVTTRRMRSTRSYARYRVGGCSVRQTLSLSLSLSPQYPSFKIGTGFKDEELETHAKFFKDHVIDAPKPYYRRGDGVKPDHWFEPVQVWEVKAADLSISPVYTAAAGIVSGP